MQAQNLIQTVSKKRRQKENLIPWPDFSEYYDWLYWNCNGPKEDEYHNLNTVVKAQEIHNYGDLDLKSIMN